MMAQFLTMRTYYYFKEHFLIGLRVKGRAKKHFKNDFIPNPYFSEKSFPISIKASIDFECIPCRVPSNLSPH